MAKGDNVTSNQLPKTSNGLVGGNLNNSAQLSSGNNTGGTFESNLYKSVVGQTANDYSNIMDQYKNLATPKPVTQLGFTPASPITADYTQSPELTGALGLFKDLATTGGYSPTDLAAIRARNLSPITSIYANAKNNLDRQRALQGGYSPSYNATVAKNTRDLADEISHQTNDTNAQIAEMVTNNKLAAIPGYTSAAANQNTLENQIAQNNADAARTTQQLNLTLPLSYASTNANLTQDEINKELAGIQGQQSLYGTSPGLANTFGNQVLEILRQQLAAAQSGLTSGSGGNPNGTAPITSPRTLPFNFGSSSSPGNGGISLPGGLNLPSDFPNSGSINLARL